MGYHQSAFNATQCMVLCTAKRCGLIAEETDIFRGRLNAFAYVQSFVGKKFLGSFSFKCFMSCLEFNVCKAQFSCDATCSVANNKKVWTHRPYSR